MVRQIMQLKILQPVKDCYIIEDDVVIGVGASLLPAIKIGKGATIAAGSVVTKDVEPKTLVAGAPARFVKRLE